MTPSELYTLAETAIAEGRSLTFPVRGDSMRPLLRPGRDSVTLSAPAEPCRVGDLVLTRAGGTSSSTPSLPSTQPEPQSRSWEPAI